MIKPTRQFSVLARISLAAALLAGIGCDSGKGDDTTGPVATQDVRHVWVATKAEFVNKAHPATRIDIVKTGGGLSLDLRNSSRFEFAWWDPDESFTYWGTWTATATRLTLSSVDVMIFNMSMNGNTLTLSGGPCEYDFDDDLEYESADLNVVLVRQ